MSNTEHDNKQNEDLQGGEEDKAKEFGMLKVVGQDNLEVHFKIKMTAFLTSKGPTRISEMRTLIAFRNFVRNEPLQSMLG